VLVTECNDLRAVQELLGHSSLATTERFYAGIGKVKARAWEAVNTLPDPRGPGGASPPPGLRAVP
jgi:integrase